MNDMKVKAVYIPPVPEEPQWTSIPAYELAYSLDRSGFPPEGGVVRFAWNERGLFVRAELEDSYLIAKSRRDEELHYESGDVFELFVKPLHDDYYWEMYATPFGNKSTLFFPCNRDGMTVDQYLRRHCFRDLEVFSEKTSTGWRTQMFIPAEQLCALGAEWGAGADWTVLCGRYNYHNDELVDPDLSMMPPLTETNFHLISEYALLSFNTRAGAVHETFRTKRYDSVTFA